LLDTGPAKKVAIYVNETQQYHGAPVYSALLEFLFYHSVSGATVTKGIAGFGADHHLHTTRLVELAAELPIKVEFIETEEKVLELLPKIRDIVGGALIEIHDTTIYSGKSKPREKVPHRKLEGHAKLMRIYVGENDRWQGKPLHEAILQALRAHQIAGATVYRGILGYGANRRIHRDSTLSLSHDRPLLLSIVDTEEKLRAFSPTLEKMIQQGLVVLSDVEIVKYTHDYQAVERRSKGRE
jgi:PII-like signaling protein